MADVNSSTYASLTSPVPFSPWSISLIISANSFRLIKPRRKRRKKRTILI